MKSIKILCRHLESKKQPSNLVSRQGQSVPWKGRRHHHHNTRPWFWTLKSLTILAFIERFATTEKIVHSLNLKRTCIYLHTFLRKQIPNSLSAQGICKSLKSQSQHFRWSCWVYPNWCLLDRFHGQPLCTVSCKKSRSISVYKYQYSSTVWHQKAPSRENV